MSSESSGRQNEDFMRLLSRHDIEDIGWILHAVADWSGYSPSVIMGRGRHQPLSEVRQVVMFLMRERLDLSYSQIGKLLDNRDHTTILYGCQKIDKLMKRHDPKLRVDIEGIIALLPVQESLQNHSNGQVSLASTSISATAIDVYPE